MRNRVISYSFMEFEVFLQVPMIIIIRFDENNVLGPIYCIDIFLFGFMPMVNFWVYHTIVNVFMMKLTV